jgi:outer membrane protein, heavy metal efflux system
MNSQLRLSATFAGAILLLVGCATTEDHDLTERRARSVYADPRSKSADPLALREGTAELTEEAPELDGVASYVEFGLANSATLRGSFEQWRAMNERIEQTSTLPDPRFTYGEFIEEVQTRTGPQERRFGISQAFPWPGQLDAQARVAAREADAAWQRVELQRLDVVSKIEVAYYDYAFLARELQTTDELLSLLRGLEPVVQGRVKSGGGQADLLKLQVEIGRLEDDLASIERRRPATWARLADALNLSLWSEPSALPELLVPELGPLDSSALYRTALERNPRLRELIEEIEANREQELLVDFKRKPSLAVGFDYIQTGDALNPSTSGSGTDPYLLSLSFSLPVWRSSYDAAEREARHRVRSANERLAAEESRLRSSLEGETFRVEDAERQIRLYRESLVPRASETLDLTLVAYRAGDASILDLIDAERVLLEFELSAWRACRDALQGISRLNALIGGAQ